MARNLKILVLGLVAVLALTAVAASSASAFTKFKADTGTNSFKGSQAGSAKFVTDPGTIECATGGFRGMVISGSEPETIETSDSTAAAGELEAGKHGLEWSTCKFLGFINLTIANNTCQFRIHASAGKVDIVPNSGECAAKGISFSALGCTVHIFPANGTGRNEGLSSLTFTNIGTGTGKSVKVEPNAIAGVAGITYTSEGCPSPTDTTSNGVYSSGSVAGGASVLLGGTTNTTNAMTASGISIL
jgi:hypothetical protein